MFIDGALYPSRAQGVLEVLHLPLQCAVISSKQFLCSCDAYVQEKDGARQEEKVN